ncbi:hypothetical protein J3L16_15435 [Alteromonas sp. 5E99-2]|uniref:hypothetical protein n=1 Tax=Alteromonas sp. 5E99-2 TaxID=2817683 RepID=UPI001A98B5EE|nr:hypothetical protein [Alteromonas sp. 5E99-2]MBO1257076.1 hypothetical protein [Alteromonas sp. 5E99-2]
MDSKKALSFWMYFLSLEKDFVQTHHFVEVTTANYATYSVEYSKILQLSCAEIDSVLRNLCTILEPQCDFPNNESRSGRIGDYKKIINKHCPEFINAEVTLTHGFNCVPWEKWSKNKPPKWWSSYNLVKHYRHSNFHEANLENVIYSLSALMIATLYLYRLVSGEKYAAPYPFPSYFVCKYFSKGLTFRGEGLPGIDA